jgi:hypothetical protein
LKITIIKNTPQCNLPNKLKKVNTEQENKTETNKNFHTINNSDNNTINKNINPQNDINSINIENNIYQQLQQKNIRHNNMPQGNHGQGNIQQIQQKIMNNNVNSNIDFMENLNTERERSNKTIKVKNDYRNKNLINTPTNFNNMKNHNNNINYKSNNNLNNNENI